MSERVNGLGRRHHLPLPGLRLERGRRAAAAATGPSAPARRDCFPASRRPPPSAASRRRPPCASRRTGGSSWRRSRAASRSSTALGDTTPTHVRQPAARKVNHYWDRGLLGLALDPDFPAKPFVYVLYTYDAPIGGTAPTWNDECPDPPGPTTNGCVSSARLSRLQAQGDQMVGAGAGADRGLVPAGPDAHDRRPALRPRRRPLRERRRRGQPRLRGLRADGHPTQPLRRPARRAWAAPRRRRPARAARCAARTCRTPADPTTPRRHPPAREPGHRRGAVRPTRSPASSDPNARRIIAYGLRNPFRFAFRPGTHEIWLGDVGWNTTEEINRVPNPADATVENFGWPCYEGIVAPGRLRRGQPQPLREPLRGRCGVTAPCLHLRPLGEGRRPRTRARPADSSVSGHGLQPVRQPAARRVRRRALLRRLRARLHLGHGARPARRCPARRTIRWFRSGAATAGGHPVRPRRRPLLRRRLGQHDQADPLHRGQPGAARGGAGHAHERATRRSPCSSTRAGRATPTATRSPTPGTSTATAPTTTRRSAPHVRPTRARGVYPVGLRVTDSHGASATDSVAITAGNTPPVATISSPPPAASRGRSAQSIHFEGSATDQQDGTSAREPAQLVARAPPLPLELPRARAPVLRRQRAAATSPRPTTSTRPTWSCGSRPPTAAGSRTRRASGSTRRR